MLKVLTLNLWRDNGPWPERMLRVRAWVDRLAPDLIAFQEVLDSPERNLARDLLADRPYELAFGRASAVQKDPSQSLGNAVASRWPIAKQERLALPDDGDGETRSAIACRIDSPHGPLVFSSTHLNWRLNHGVVRERQVVALSDFVTAQHVKGEFSPIIAGDFNAEPDSDEIRYMTGRHSLGGRSVYWNDAWLVAGHGDGTTWSNRNRFARVAWEPERRIDYVFAGNPRAGGRGHVEVCRVVCDDERGGIWPSDHFGVYAELRTEPLEA